MHIRKRIKEGKKQRKERKNFFLLILMSIFGTKVMRPMELHYLHPCKLVKYIL